MSPFYCKLYFVPFLVNTIHFNIHDKIFTEQMILPNRNFGNVFYIVTRKKKKDDSQLTKLTGCKHLNNYLGVII